jgi:hypothetical protein
MYVRFGMWDVRSVYRAGSLVTPAGEISKYKLDLVRVHEVRWDGGGTERAGEYTFFFGKGNEKDKLDTGSIFVWKRIISAVKRIEFVSGRMSHIILSHIRGYRD